MDLQQKIQKVLDHAVEKGTECGCQAVDFKNRDWPDTSEIPN